MLFWTLIKLILLTLNAYKLLKTRAPVITVSWLQDYILTTPKGWTRPSEISTWNTSPTKMVFCQSIGMILLNSKRILSKNSCPREHTSWIQGTPLDHTIWNTSPMKMLSFALIGVTIWNYTRIQTPKNCVWILKEAYLGASTLCEPGNAARNFQKKFAGQNGGVTQE